MAKVIGVVLPESFRLVVGPPATVSIQYAWTCDLLSESVGRGNRLDFTFSELKSITLVVDRVRAAIKSEAEAEFSVVLAPDDLLVTFSTLPGFAQVLSNLSLTSLVFVDLDGLMVPVQPSGVYTIEAYILYSNNNVGSGLSLGVNGPAAPGKFAIQTTIFDNKGPVMENIGAYNTGTGALKTLTAGATNLARLTGTFVNGPNTGALTIRCKKTAAPGTITIYTGSTLTAVRIQP